MRKILFTVSFLLLASVSLTACTMPKISWEEPEEEVEEVATTLTGVLFPFDVSVATKATHRLEADKKLVALVASDIVNLEIFEGKLVEMVGFLRLEDDKRNIFWVHSLDLKESLDDLVDEEELFDDELVQEKDYSFLYPKKWELLTAPNETLYFSDKADVNRRAFFNFSVVDTEESDADKERNILIAGLKGHKDISSEEKRERQLIELYSNDEAKKYVFQFNSLFEEFEKKNAFFELLNSFTVGEAGVQKVVAARQKLVAEKKEAATKKQDEMSEIRAQLEALKEAESLANTDEEEDEDTLSVIDRLLDFTKTSDKELAVDDSKNDETDVSTETEEKTEIVSSETGAVNDFENLIDSRAYAYESEFYGLSLKIPYGFWFQNFGDANGNISVIGVQKSPIESLAGTDFQIKLVKKAGGASATTESVVDGLIVIEAPRPGFENSVIQIVGPAKYRDAMLSVLSTVK